MLAKRISGRVLLSFIAISAMLFADEFVVKSFKRLDNDLSARRFEKKDISGQSCALIKVRTDIRDRIQFDSNMGIPHSPELKQSGEWWVYVSPGERTLIMMAEGFIPLTSPLSGAGYIESLVSYEMVLSSKDILARSIEKDLFTLTFNLNVDGVYIKKDQTAAIKTTGTVAGYELPGGIYHFVFQKEGYKTYEESIEVTESLQKDINLSRGYSDYQAALPGIVMISSDPSGAEIYLNDQYIGITPYQGEIFEGDYILRLQKEFYHSKEKSFTIKPKTVMEIPAVKLEPNYGYLSVQSTPAAADVYLNGSVIGKTPIAQYQLETGLYNLNIRKNLFKDVDTQVRIEDLAEKNENYPLEPLFGMLKVDCKNVTEADVYLNNRPIGQTPVQIDTLPFGTYELLIRKELYKDFSEKLEVSGKLTERNLILLQNHGFLDISAEGCDIYINDALVGKNYIRQAFLPGTYRLKALMDDIHYPAEEDVFLGNGETRHVPLEPKYITGSVSIIANPVEAGGSDIYVNGILQKEKTPAVLTLPIGTHTITIKHPDFLEKTLDPITLKENEYVNKSFTMQTYKGSLKEKENFWKTQKWIGVGGSVLIGGLGGGGNYMGWETYKDYAVAGTVSEAVQLRDMSQLYFLGRDVSYGVSVSSLLYAGFSWVQELRFKEYQEEGKGFLEKIFGEYKPK